MTTAQVRAPISWLVSYPKSGNTWLRILLSNFISGQDVPIDINDIKLKGSISCDRFRFDELSGLPSSELTPDEVDSLRPFVFERAGRMAQKKHEHLFIKVHDAYYLNSNNEPLFPSNVSHGVVYIIRNPLDVAVSLAFHNGFNFKDAIKVMSKTIGPGPGYAHQQLHEITKDWSSHALSWTEQKEMAVKIIRYEDLLQDTQAVFSSVVKFLAIDRYDDVSRVKKAVDFSSFQTLRDNERLKGFRERPTEKSIFFRSGKKDDWKNHLTAKQAQKVINTHKDVMKKFGYPTDLKAYNVN